MNIAAGGHRSSGVWRCVASGEVTQETPCSTLFSSSVSSPGREVLHDRAPCPSVYGSGAEVQDTHTLAGARRGRRML